MYRGGWRFEAFFFFSVFVIIFFCVASTTTQPTKRSPVIQSRVFFFWEKRLFFSQKLHIKKKPSEKREGESVKIVERYRERFNSQTVTTPF